jgi:hypothetical protein
MKSRVHVSGALFLGFLFSLSAAGAASAQSFNVDYGGGYGGPSDAYEAAARQPGVWNTITGLEADPVPLLDVDGRLTSVVIVPSLPFGESRTDFPALSGDDHALLDDYFDIHSTPSTFEIRGLAPGGYAVYTYAFAPDADDYRTIVGINGRRTVLVGGGWPGTFVEGITHARHVVGVAPGKPLDVTLLGIGHGTLNGFQIVRLGGSR